VRSPQGRRFAPGRAGDDLLLLFARSPCEQQQPTRASPPSGNEPPSADLSTGRIAGLV
jgi:hypothetical protein